MPSNILNLSTYCVSSIDETDHDYHIRVDIKNPPTHCKYCASTDIVGFGRREQLIKDLPMHGKRVGIYVTTRRMKCNDCTKTFSEVLPEANPDHAMTNRLVTWIGKQSIQRTFLSIAEEVGITEGTVRLIFKEYVAALEERIKFETPKFMGIDEIHLIQPRCVIANIQDRTIIDMLPDRKQKTVSTYLTRLQGKENVQYVAMDMWLPYRDAVKSVLPQAKIVIDKFHVVRMANDAMERARKSLREELTPKQRRGLMHDRYVLLKRERDLTEKDQFNLDGWTKNYPLLGEAYRLKESFYEIYDAKSPMDAQRRFSSWRQGIPQELLPLFSDLIRAWSNWERYILTYFENPITNAYTESLNNLIRVMNRLGRGYSFEALRAKILFAEGAYKHETKRPSFSRRDHSRVAERRSHGYQIDAYDMDIPRPRPSTQKEPETVNLGVDISTLARMIENDEL